MRHFILTFFLLGLIACEGNIIKDILSTMENKPVKEQFKVFHFLYNKSYDLNSEEGIKRYKIFKSSLKYIKERNSQGLSYTLGPTPFADLTHEEFVSKHLMKKAEFRSVEQENLRFLEESYFDLHADEEVESRPVDQTTTYDWSSYFLSARDQGICGCCFTFSAAAALEGAYYAKYKTKVSFSTQQLVDCDTTYPNSGCDGGLSNYSFKYIKTNGVVLDSLYPFTSGTSGSTGSCKSSVVSASNKTKLSSYNYCVNSKYEGETVKTCTQSVWVALLAGGPMVVNMDASSDPDFMYYSSGIWDPKVSCTTSDHAVTAVGWKYDSSVSNYVITVRNSWSTWWGESGNFRVKYNSSNADTCQITGAGYRPVL
jgi:C1A family cysteine protease